MLTKVLTGGLTFQSLKPCDLSNCTKSEIKEYFNNTYDLNESIFTALKDESVFYKCPDRLRLPLIFYYGHTASVYVNKLVLAGLLKPEDRVNLEYETMFETGVDEMSWDDTENFRMGGKFAWPRIENVVEYRRKVRNIIKKIIEDTPLELPVTMESPWWGLFMGMEHERIHLETSSVLIRQLPVELVNKPDDWTYAPASYGEGVGKNPMIKVESTNVTLGKPKDFPSYGWDIEYGQQHIEVPAFEASKYMITNREFAEFLRAGGYEKREYWTDEAWKWVEYRKAKHPTFWACDRGCTSGCGASLNGYSHCKPEPTLGKSAQHLSNGQNSYCNGHDSTDDNGHQGKDEGGGLASSYRYRCMFDMVPMPWDWPVDVNYHEAKAYCAWKGPEYRLLAEAEHNALRGTQKSPSEGTACDIIYEDDPKANFNLKYGSSTPVNMIEANDLGFHDVFGNVWEWVEDHFNGLPGFNTSYLYDDFSSPCLDGRHNLMLGGSWISTGDEASRFARFAFRRHFFQHLGFRLARSIKPEDSPVKLPVQTVNTEVYVYGVGYQTSEVYLDSSQYEYNSSPSTYKHYLRDSPSDLDAMLRSEYGGDSYPQRLMEKCLGWVEEYDIARSHALHMGCGTGAGTWKMAERFDHVLGQDFGARFIDACTRLQEGETLTFPVCEGSDNAAQAKAPEFNLGYNNIIFKQLTWLPNEVEYHDFILVTFLDRVQNAHSWLVRLNEILKKDGLLVFSSPQDLDEEYLLKHIGHQFTVVEATDLSVNATETQRVVVMKHKH